MTTPEHQANTDEKEQRNISLRGSHRQISLAYDFSNTLPNLERLHKLDGRMLGTSLLCMSLVETANALNHLLDHGFITTSFMVSRALVEGTINYCFLLQCEDQHFELWISYSRQKAFRLLNRQARAGDLEFKMSYSGTPDPAQIPGLEDDIKQFTGAKGGEKHRWTELTIEQRLALLDSYQADNKSIVKLLLIALTSAFDLGSEALHGTLLGAGYSRGLFAVPGLGLDDQYDQLMFVGTICVSCMLQCGAVKAGLPEIATASRSSLEATLRLSIGEAEWEQLNSDESSH